MSIFELREIIEKSIPWYYPIVGTVGFIIAVFIYEKIK